MRHTLAAQGAPGAVVGAHCWQVPAGTLISQPSHCLSARTFLRLVRAKYFPSPVYLFVKCLIWGKRGFFSRHTKRRWRLEHSSSAGWAAVAEGWPEVAEMSHAELWLVWGKNYSSWSKIVPPERLFGELMSFAGEPTKQWRSPGPVGFREPWMRGVFQDCSRCPKWTNIKE